MLTQPTFTWSVSNGVGTITSAGIYTAPRAAGSANIVSTSTDNVVGHATVTVFYEVLAWYQADASSGTTLADSSTFNQTATLTGATAFTAGVSGNALALSGGYASLPTGIVGSLNDFTIAAWVNVTTLAAWARIFDFGTGTNDYMFLTPDAGGNGAWRFAITTSGNGAEQQVNGPAVTTGVWTHIAVTLAGNLATMYINGVAVANNNDVTIHPTNLGPTSQNYLGKSQFPADPTLTGSIDDFRIYSRGSIGSKEVQELAIPSIVTAAATSASPVTTTKTNLSVAASDVTAGESALTYAWATTGVPPAPVTFSINGTNAAKNTTATFTKAGTYNFSVTVMNPVDGLATTSSVSVVVNQTLTTISVTPNGLSLRLGATQQFAASGVDQFGATMVNQPSYIFTVGSASVGSITTSGLYSAPTTGSGGSVTVLATSGTITGSASLVVTNAAPTIVTAAAATPSPVTGTSAKAIRN